MQWPLGNKPLKNALKPLHVTRNLKQKWVLSDTFSRVVLKEKRALNLVEWLHVYPSAVLGVICWRCELLPERFRMLLITTCARKRPSATGHSDGGFLRTFDCVNNWNDFLQLLLGFGNTLWQSQWKAVWGSCFNTVSWKIWKRVVESFSSYRNLEDN